MCGIAGYLDASLNTTEGDLRGISLGMAETLRHRGPDDGGVWVDPAAGLAFGHRRLAILDLSVEGRQPMVSATGRYVVILNGEIYNFRRLRRELEGSGERFRGHSDTEVLLAAISRWGLEGALPKLNGMFAFALWDRSSRALSLVRDRLGEKPLYYGWLGRAFVFASELKALRVCPGFDAQIDRGALAALLRHKYVPSPLSVYQGIKKLPPGCVLEVRAADLPPGREARPYWSAREAAERGVSEPFNEGESEAVDALNELVRDAVRIRMESDVPLGAFLSGGVDSSTVVALMQQESTRPVRTFTVGFEDKGFDEAQHGRAVAEHLGTDHTEVTVTHRDALDVIPRLATLYDEPFCDSSQIPTYLISEVARRYVTVALSGDGGDELFGGYNRHAWLMSIWRRVRWMPLPLRRACGSALRSISPGTWDSMFRAAGRTLPTRLRQRNPGTKVHKLSEMLAAGTPEHMYLAATSHWKDPAAVVIGAQEPPPAITDRSRWAEVLDFTQLMMYLDSVTYLPDDILTKVDRASMGVSLEARVPLLDHRVFEFAWRLPAAMKVRDGRGKWLLREVLDRYVPRDLIDRPKMGFGIPLGAWLREPLREWAEDLLDEGRLRGDGIFEPEPIRALWAEHLSGRRDAQYALWDVLMVQSWLDSTASARLGRAHTR